MGYRDQIDIVDISRSDVGKVPGRDYLVFETSIDEVRIGDWLFGSGLEVSTISRAQHEGQPALRFSLSLQGDADVGHLIVANRPEALMLVTTDGVTRFECTECGNLRPAGRLASINSFPYTYGLCIDCKGLPSGPPEEHPVQSEGAA